MDLDLQLSIEAMDHVLKFDGQLGNDILYLPKVHVSVCKTVAEAGLEENYHLSIALHEVHSSFIIFLAKWACKVILELYNRIPQKNIRKHKFTNCCCFVG